MSRLLVIAALLLPACVSHEVEQAFDDAVPAAVEDDPILEGFGNDARPYDGPEGQAPIDDGDDDDVPVGDDDDDEPDTPIDEGWDSSPPEGVVDGSLLHLEMTCALLDGVHTKSYRWQDDRWHEFAGTGRGLFPEFIPCVGTERDRWLTWEAPDAMYIMAGGMHHDLWPTPTVDRWLGEVYVDHGTSSQRCLDALANAGLSWPVVMSVTVTGIDL